MTLSGRPLYPQESAVPSGAHLHGLGVCSACLLTHGWQQLSPCTGDYTTCLASSLTAQQQVLMGTSFFVWQQKCFLSKKLFKGSKDQNVMSFFHRQNPTLTAGPSSAIQLRVPSTWRDPKLPILPFLLRVLALIKGILSNTLQSAILTRVIKKPNFQVQKNVMDVTLETIIPCVSPSCHKLLTSYSMLRFQYINLSSCSKGSFPLNIISLQVQDANIASNWVKLMIIWSIWTKPLR